MIAVIGLGFVGLTTALGFSEKGYTVYGYDKNRAIIERLLRKEVPFHEPHLQDVLRKNLNKSFFIGSDIGKAMRDSKYVFICVGTPSEEDGSVDLKPLTAVLEEILPFTRSDNFKILIIKSTIPPSTTKDTITKFIEERGYQFGKEIGLACNPEFLREGFAWNDFMMPDRIVIGSQDGAISQSLKELYKPFNAPVYCVSLNTAEYVKYLSNTLLSTMISYANEMSLIGKTIGDIDIAGAFKILHKDRRWFGEPASMSSYVYPGCGFGGYCLPKDTAALYAESKKRGYEPRMLKEVMNINQSIKAQLIQEIVKTIRSDQRITVLGLSFKPGSDDVRDTPAAPMIELLLQNGYRDIVAYDPLAVASFRHCYDFEINYSLTMEDALKGASAAVILCAWDEFKDKQNLLRDLTVFDFRYCLV